jgi:hypothetical protein
MQQRQRPEPGINQPLGWQPPGDAVPSRTALALTLMAYIQDVAECASQDELWYIAWRAMQMANDLSFAASDAGAAQRRRLADAASRALSDAA